MLPEGVSSLAEIKQYRQARDRVTLYVGLLEYLLKTITPDSDFKKLVDLVASETFPNNMQRRLVHEARVIWNRLHHADPRVTREQILHAEVSLREAIDTILPVSLREAIDTILPRCLESVANDAWGEETQPGDDPLQGSENPPMQSQQTVIKPGPPRGSNPQPISPQSPAPQGQAVPQVPVLRSATHASQPALSSAPRPPLPKPTPPSFKTPSLGAPGISGTPKRATCPGGVKRPVVPSRVPIHRISRQTSGPDAVMASIPSDGQPIAFPATVPVTSPPVEFVSTIRDVEQPTKPPEYSKEHAREQIRLEPDSGLMRRKLARIFGKDSSTSPLEELASYSPIPKIWPNHLYL